MVIKNLNIYTLQDNPTWIQQKLNDRSHIIEQAENDTSTSSSLSLLSLSLTLSSSLSLSMSTPEPLKGESTSEKGTSKAPKLVSRSKNGHPKQTPKAMKSLVQKCRLNVSSTRNPSAKKAKRDSVEMNTHQCLLCLTHPQHWYVIVLLISTHYNCHRFKYSKCRNRTSHGTATILS